MGIRTCNVHSGRITEPPQAASCFLPTFYLGPFKNLVLLLVCQDHFARAASFAPQNDLVSSPGLRKAPKFRETLEPRRRQWNRSKDRPGAPVSKRQKDVRPVSRGPQIREAQLGISWNVFFGYVSCLSNRRVECFVCLATKQSWTMDLYKVTFLWSSGGSSGHHR